MPLLPTTLCFPVPKPTSAPAGAASDPNLVELFHLAAEAGRSGETPSPEHHIDCTPFQLRRSPSFVLSFYELTYAITLRRLPGAHSYCSRRTILDSISGAAREGEILAVMGASGSGKSTLIDALADRIAKASLGGGGVCLNGEPLDSKIQKTISAYVMQDDLLFPMLTVEETLTFAAEFRLPRSLSAAKKRARVQALMDQLGLRSASSTIIGDEGHRGVSGGERRRVSIGTDIVHDPILLFLDEPTSGLDSTSAYMVAQVLQRIARTGSVVVTSIHQPSARVLALLDRLMLLSKGRTVFFGRPEELTEFFARFGRPMPEGENRAEFALDVVRELDAGEGGGSELVEYFRERRRLGLAGGGTTTEFSASPGRTPHSAFSLQAAISASISRGKLFAAASVGATSSATSTEMPQFVNPWFVELAVLTRRSFTNTLRMPELFLMRLAATTITGGILATVFFHLDSSPRGVQERLGFFAFAMSTMYYTCADALPVFLHERYIFLRETAHNAYRRSSYVLSNSLVALPALVLLSVAFAVTTFSAVGLSGSFLFYFLAVLASFWAGSGFVTFLSGVVSSVMLGYVIVVALLAYFLLFSGFFVERDRIPGYWIWFHYLSLVKYPYEGVLRNEFGAEGKCFVRGLQVFDVTPLRGMTDQAKATVLAAIGRSLGVNISSDTCLTTGADVLTQNAVTQLGKWWCLGVTVAWGFLFRVLFYLALLFGSSRNRRK